MADQVLTYVKIKGKSIGLNLGYKVPIAKSILLKPGIGYYSYSFNNINTKNTLFGESNVRNINFPSPVSLSFYTNKYRYNTIAVNVGVEKIFNFKRNMQISTGLNFNNYFTISQYYHLSFNPEGSQDFKKDNRRYFATSVNLNFSLLKRIAKINIGPSLVIPVFDIWKTDETFPEETNTASRNKWLGGIGLGFCINYVVLRKQMG